MIARAAPMKLHILDICRLFIIFLFTSYSHLVLEFIMKHIEEAVVMQSDYLRDLL